MTAQRPAYPSQLHRAQLADGQPAQLIPRRDLELLEDLAEVVLHSSMADEQLGADFGVGEPFSGQSGDLCFLRRQHHALVVGSPAQVPAGSQKFSAGTFGERFRTDVVEGVVSGQ